MIRVMVADDHPDVRRRLVRLLRRPGDIEVVAEAADGVEALQVLGSREVEVEVLLLDLTMPRKSGGETLREVTAGHPAVKVVIVSMHPPSELATQMIALGAKGYVGKDRLGECLLDAIRAVHAGGVYLDAGEAPARRVGLAR
jgi:two-component system invasion response regulator UvrY